MSEAADDDAPAVSPELAKLLDEEREVPDVSLELRGQVRQGVARATHWGGSDGGGSTGSGPSVAGSKIAALASHGIAFLVGGVAGVLLYAALAPDGARVSTAPPSDGAAQIATDETVALEPEPRVTPDPTAPPPPPHARNERAGATRGERAIPRDEDIERSLSREQRILDVARGALSRGRAESALEATDRHAHLYPTGQLTEEREAIAIRALAALGRADEARARATLFESSHPGSFLQSAVSDAVAASGEAP